MAIPTSGTYTFSIYILQDATVINPLKPDSGLRFRVEEGVNFGWRDVSVTFSGSIMTFTDSQRIVHALSYRPDDIYGQKDYHYDSVVLTSSNSPFRHFILSAEPIDAIKAPDYVDYTFVNDTWQLGPRTYKRAFPTNNAFEDIVCFLRNTQIATSEGLKYVQDVRPGDLVAVLNQGASRLDRVTWVGQGHCRVRMSLPDDEAGFPIRIRAGAFAPQVPALDLLVTADHCLYCDGVFIPARMLVNGLSILYEKSAIAFNFYHLETETHAVIRANGLLTESYLDTGNRAGFRKGIGDPAVSGGVKTWASASGAPLAVTRDVVEPLHYELQQRGLKRCVFTS